MYILSVETALGKESCAISKNGKSIAFSEGDQTGLQAEKLFDHINKVLEITKLSYDDIDVFAADLGPGSFTGIRIGLSAILGICQAQDKKFLGVSSLEALAYKATNINKVEKVYVAIDAGREEAYFQEFEIKDGKIKELFQAQMSPRDKIMFAEIGNIPECKTQSVPNAVDVGFAAYNMIKNNIANFNRKSPIYLRAPDAKIDH